MTTIRKNRRVNYSCYVIFLLQLYQHLTKKSLRKTHAFVGHLILTHMDTQILCNFDRPFTSVCSSIALTSLFSPAHRSGYDTQVCSRQPAEAEMTLKFGVTSLQKRTRPSLIPSPPRNQAKTWLVFIRQLTVTAD